MSGQPLRCRALEKSWCTRIDRIGVEILGALAQRMDRDALAMPERLALYEQLELEISARADALHRELHDQEQEDFDVS